MKNKTTIALFVVGAVINNAQMQAMWNNKSATPQKPTTKEAVINEGKITQSTPVKPGVTDYVFGVMWWTCTMLSSERRSADTYAPEPEQQSVVDGGDVSERRASVDSNLKIAEKYSAQQLKKIQNKKRKD